MDTLSARSDLSEDIFNCRDFRKRPSRFGKRTSQTLRRRCDTCTGSTSRKWGCIEVGVSSRKHKCYPPSHYIELSLNKKARWRLKEEVKERIVKKKGQNDKVTEDTNNKQAVEDRRFSKTSTDLARITKKQKERKMLRIRGYVNFVGMTYFCQGCNPHRKSPNVFPIKKGSHRPQFLKAPQTPFVDVSMDDELLKDICAASSVEISVRHNETTEGVVRLVSCRPHHTHYEDEGYAVWALEGGHLSSLTYNNGCGDTMSLEGLPECTGSKYHPNRPVVASIFVYDSIQDVNCSGRWCCCSVTQHRLTRFDFFGCRSPSVLFSYSNKRQTYDRTNTPNKRAIRTTRRRIRKGRRTAKTGSRRRNTLSEEIRRLQKPFLKSQ